MKTAKFNETLKLRQYMRATIREGLRLMIPNHLVTDSVHVVYRAVQIPVLNARRAIGLHNFFEADSPS